MKTITVAAALLIAISGNANAAIDPMAYEVVMQTWYGKISHADKDKYCNANDNKAAKAIIRRYHSNATREGKAQLTKAYKTYIFDNC